MLDKKLEKLGEKSSEVKRLKSISGVGTKLSSDWSEKLEISIGFKNERQLAIYCGVACIDDESGKHKRTRSCI
ncbi:MAG: hypothetical protein KIIPBIDF_01269 [Candidatus Methanoperedenaceae archaeon GB50]|nr:MAG: hypothetical protein KIIPBIDF_01269 [Candidatus Methanoperedenaceae archaeon GB50]